MTWRRVNGPTTWVDEASGNGRAQMQEYLSLDGAGLITMGTGAPPATRSDGTAWSAGDRYFRRDTPGTSGSRGFIYNGTTARWEGDTPGGVPFIPPATVGPLTNPTAQTNLQSGTVPGWAINKTSMVVRIFGSGLLTTGVATPLAVVVKLGSINLTGPTAMTSVAIATGLTNVRWQFFVIVQIVTSGSSGVLRSFGQLQVSTGAVGGAMGIYPDTCVADSSTIDLTANQTLQVTGALTTGNAANRLTQNQLMVDFQYV